MKCRPSRLRATGKGWVESEASGRIFRASEMISDVRQGRVHKTEADLTPGFGSWHPQDKKELPRIDDPSPVHEARPEKNADIVTFADLCITDADRLEALRTGCPLKVESAHGCMTPCSPPPVVDPEPPDEAPFAFLCYPSSDDDDYGWNATGDPLTSTGYFDGEWYSPVVRVTEAGHEWGVECIDVGRDGYWTGDNHTPESPESVSWGYRMAYDPSGSRGRRDYVWDGQEIAVDDAGTAGTVGAACRTTIGAVEYYRWYVPTRAKIEQRPVDGGATTQITVTPGPATLLNGAHFSASGHKLALHYYGKIYEVDIGEQLEGAIASTLMAEAEYLDVTWSETEEGNDLHKTYDGRYLRPIGAGYAGETLQILRYVTRETGDIYSETTEGVSEGPGETNVDHGAGTVGAQAVSWIMWSDGRPIFTLMWDLAGHRARAGSVFNRTVQFTLNGTAIGEEIEVAKSEWNTDKPLYLGDPDYTGYLEDAPDFPIDQSGIDPCELFFNQTFCVDAVWSEVSIYCSRCQDLDPGAEVLEESWSYDDFFVPEYGIDAAGGVAPFVLAGYRSANTVRGNDGYTARSAVSSEAGSVLAGCAGIESGAVRAIAPGILGGSRFREPGTETELRDRLYSYVQRKTTIQSLWGAVAKKLSTGQVVWSARASWVGKEGEYTEIDGAAVAWMPSGASLIGVSRYGLVEVACPND